MRTYVCDSCKSLIADPYFFKMKEFYYTWEYDTTIAKIPAKVKYKIHLCNDCFKGLKEIGKGAQKNDRV